MTDIPRDLIEQFAAGTGSVFAGAGISLGAGLPGWAKLVEPLRADIPDCPENASFLDIAQFFENQFDRHLLSERVRKMLEGGQPSKLHSDLVKLMVAGRIYTTNLDNLLEVAAVRAKVDFRKTVNTDPPVSFDRGRLSLIKLHGDVDQPLSYVITAQDYESYFRKYPGMTRLIATEFQTGSVLFIGYSHSDVDFRMILRRIRDENGIFSRVHYTLQVNPCAPVVKDLERRGLRVIRIRSKPDPVSISNSIRAWLKEFSHQIREVSDSVHVSTGSASGPRHNFPVPAHTKLFGRQDDFEKLLEALSRPGYSLVALVGDPGVGKTALAYDVGLACLSGREDTPKFDYAIWVSANRPNQKKWFKEVMNLIALTVTGERYSDAGSAYSSDKYRLVASKRVLVIINNFEMIDDSELTHWIEGLPEQSRVLITTRRIQFADMARCFRISLTGLQRANAVEFAWERVRALGLSTVIQKKDIEPLAEISDGNPLVIHLALGLVDGGRISLSDVVEQLRGVPDGIVHEALLEALFAWAWRLLSDDARRVLLITTLFVGTSVIRLEALLRVSLIVSADFERAVDQLIEFKLIDPTYDGRVITHSMTRAFARRKLEDRPELRKSATDAFVQYYLEFTELNIKRKQPGPPYWNALVTDGMRKIDPEWPSIQAAMKWASEDDFVRFVLLLVHYLDSRFFNEERIDCVSRAIEFLMRAKRTDEEALLRIDALGWTLAEANHFPEALEQIEKGLTIGEHSSPASREELRSLGLAWKARILAEQGLFQEANRLITEALQFVATPTWILHRVKMAAGDIALKQGSFEKAHQYYMICAELTRKHGDEGHGYQISPRLGLACIGLKKVDEAEMHFKNIDRFEQIIVGRMYSQYGLALVAHARGKIEEANALLAEVRAQHASRGRSSLLLKLIEDMSGRMNASY